MPHFYKNINYGLNISKHLYKMIQNHSNMQKKNFCKIYQIFNTLLTSLTSFGFLGTFRQITLKFFGQVGYLTQQITLIFVCGTS